MKWLRSGNFTRRKFFGEAGQILKIVALASGGVFSFLVKKAHALAKLPEGYQPLDHEYCMGIDIDKCIGC